MFVVRRRNLLDNKKHLWKRNEKPERISKHIIIYSCIFIHADEFRSLQCGFYTAFVMIFHVRRLNITNEVTPVVVTLFRFSKLYGASYWLLLLRRD